MKVKSIQRLLLLAAFCPVFAQAQSAEAGLARDAVFSNQDEVDYDGQLDSMWFSWGFEVIRPPSIGGRPRLASDLKCAHLNINYWRGYWDRSEFPEVNKYNCTYSVIKLDFAKREIVVLIDLLKERSKREEKDQPQARYLASISGTETDFFAPLREKPAELTDKVNTLNEVLTRLTTIKTKFSQKRHMNGSVVIRRLGKMLWNPLNLDSVAPLVRIENSLAVVLPNESMLRVQLDSKDLSLEMRSSPEQARKFESAKPLFDSLSRTLVILKKGYDRLREASDDQSQEVFRKEIQNHVGEIRQELKNVIVAMNNVHTEQNKSIHLMEMVWFMNEVSALVSAVDAILLDKYGKGPAFTEILNQSN